MLLNLLSIFNSKYDYCKNYLYKLSSNMQWSVIFIYFSDECLFIFPYKDGPLFNARYISTNDIIIAANKSKMGIYSGYVPFYIMKYTTMILFNINIYKSQLDNRPIWQMCNFAKTHIYGHVFMSWCTIMISLIDEGARSIYLSGTNSKSKYRHIAMLALCLSINESSILITTTDTIEELFCPWIHKLVVVNLTSNEVLQHEAKAINNIMHTKKKIELNGNISYYEFDWDGIILISGRSRVKNKISIEYQCDINTDKIKTIMVPLPPVSILCQDK